jgi:hypothetical protein
MALTDRPGVSDRPQEETAERSLASVIAFLT